MRHHKRLTQNTGVDVYFAHPRARWERVINESTNGLLRQYLPKGTDLSVFSQEQLDDGMNDCADDETCEMRFGVYFIGHPRYALSS